MKIIFVILKEPRDTIDPFFTLSLVLYHPGSVPLQEGDSGTGNSLTILQGQKMWIKPSGAKNAEEIPRNKLNLSHVIPLSIFLAIQITYCDRDSFFTFINLEYSFFCWFFVPIISS